jgi:hypothetical protein
MSSATSKQSQSKPDARPLAVLLALPPDAVLNPEEVRIYSRLKSRQAVYNWLRDPNDPLPASKHAGWRIVKRDLDAFLRRRHNRRATDGEDYGTSDETLRRHVGLLIEVGQATIAWRRARRLHRTAMASVDSLESPPDLEWLDSTFAEAEAAGVRLQTLSQPLNEETLTRLRFMLPSIHSDIALVESRGEYADGEEAESRDDETLATPAA